MRRTRATRLVALWAAIGLVGSIGCTHNHYYYTAPVGAVGACDPVSPSTIVPSTGVASAAPRLGAVCDEPPQGPFGAQMVQGAARPAPVASNAGSPVVPRPIYSQPRGGSLVARRNSGLAWRATSPESASPTKVTGDYDDEATLR